MKNKIFSDHRGYNMKFFEKHIAEEYGFKEVKEVYATVNTLGTIRAFHWQAQPKPQQKIVKPLSGRFNVRVIDTENKKVIEYNDVNNTSDPIFVKEGNMLGYVALEENSVMLYIADEEFVSELNSGVNPYSFGVNWDFNGKVVLNERDSNNPIIQFEDL